MIHLSSETILEFILSCLDSLLFVIIAILCNFIDNPNNFRNRILLFIITFATLMVWLPSVLVAGFHLPVNMILSIALYVLLLRITPLHAALGMLFSTVSIALLDIISLLPLLIITKSPDSVLSSTLPRFFLCSFVKITIIIILSKLIRKNRKLNFYPQKMADFFPYEGVLCLVWLMFMTTVFFFSPIVTIIKQTDMIILMFASFVFFTIFTSFEIKRRKDVWNKLAVLSAYKNQQKSTEETILLMRQEKHEQFNRLSVLKAMTKLPPARAIAEIAKYLEEYPESEPTFISKYSTGIQSLDILLANKTGITLSHGIHLDIDPEIALPPDILSVSEIISIFGNLIDNAVEAILSDSSRSAEHTIWVDAWSENNEWIMEVSNNGPQINDRVIDNLFIAGSTTKTSDQLNHGLGLSIVRFIIQKHMGKISVCSHSDKTTFMIRVPSANGIP